jgi:hypothetical protein
VSCGASAVAAIVRTLREKDLFYWVLQEAVNALAAILEKDAANVNTQDLRDVLELKDVRGKDIETDRDGDIAGYTNVAIDCSRVTALAQAETLRRGH